MHKRGIVVDELRIVAADLGHLGEILRVEESLFPIEPFSRRAYRYLIDAANADVLVGLLDGKIIGHGVGVQKRLRSGKLQGRIYSIGILAEFRRKGYAGALLAALEKRLRDREVSFISLETHKDHAGSICFFAGHGYAKTKDIPGYYEDGDGIGMRKDFVKHPQKEQEKTMAPLDREAAVHPDFTGNWRFNPDRSSLEITAPESTVFIIQHEEPLFRVDRKHVINGKTDEMTISLKTDGVEVVQTIGPLEVHTTLHWEGEELVLVSRFPGYDPEADNTVRYRLESDGRTLVVDERLRSSRLNYDNTWVFDRF